MEEKITISVKDVISFIIVACISILIIFLGMVLVGNKSEIYDDIILGVVANDGANRTGELNVFWIILFAGIPILLAINYCINRKQTKQEDKELKDFLSIELIISIAQIMLYIITGNINSVLVCAMIITFLDYMISPGREKKGLILSIIIYYFLLSLCAIYNNRGGKIILNDNVLLIITIFINLIVISVDKKKEIINKLMLLMQITIPALLLLYACQRYNYQGKILYVSIPTIAKMLIYGAVILMFFFALFNLVKKWKKAEELPLNKIILVTTCMIIFAINCGTETQMVVPEDLQHSGEEIISYQQIIEKGQIPYTKYSPVSGLFPVLIGLVLEIFGGNISAFNLAHTIYLAIFAMLTIFILAKHISKEDCLIVAMMFCFPSYDRATLILPAILILLLPDLIKNKNLWLKVWIWTCFICGIYYPTFGGAILVGTLPFGIVQFYTFIKEEDFKQKLKSFKFYLSWILCLLPIIISLPMLYNMARHILIYSSQAILSEGRDVFGQTVPDYYLPYLSNIKYIRQIIYYGIRYMIPAASVWLLVLILSKTMKKGQIKEEIKQERFLALTCGMITLIISYTYTNVRMEVSDLVSRSAYVIIPIIGVLLFLIIKKYMKKNVAINIVLGLTLGVGLILGKSPVLNLNKSIYAYTLNNNYQMIAEKTNDEYARLGNGFILNTQINTLKQLNNKVNSLLTYDSNLKFLAVGDLGVYYTLDLTTVGQPSIGAFKDYQTSQEVINAIKEQKPVIGMSLSPTMNYYLYTWLLTTNEYIYDEKYELFIPVELYKKIYGEEVSLNDKRKVPIYASNIGLIANSLGKSIQSLKKIFNTVDISILKKETTLTEDKTFQYNIELNRKIYGADADYLYIEFDIDGNIYPDGQSKLARLLTKQYYNKNINVIVSWGEDKKESMKANLNDGKLLFPLGSNASWLLNHHQDIKITIENVDKEINIREIDFYQLQTEEENRR